MHLLLLQVPYSIPSVGDYTNQEVQDAPDLFNVPVPSNEALTDTRKPVTSKDVYVSKNGIFTHIHISC